MEHRMSMWIAIPLAVGIIGAIVAVMKRRTSGVTSLRIHH